MNSEEMFIRTMDANEASAYLEKTILKSNQFARNSSYIWWRQSNRIMLCNIYVNTILSIPVYPPLIFRTVYENFENKLETGLPFE